MFFYFICHINKIPPCTYSRCYYTLKMSLQFNLLFTIHYALNAIRTCIMLQTPSRNLYGDSMVSIHPVSHSDLVEPPHTFWTCPKLCVTQHDHGNILYIHTGSTGFLQCCTCSYCIQLITNGKNKIEL